LDSDPLGKHIVSPDAAPCKDGEGGCLTPVPTYIVVHAGWLAKVFIISGAPAFLTGTGIAHGLAEDWRQRSHELHGRDAYPLRELVLFCWMAS
jgi:hypothetical protein